MITVKPDATRRTRRRNGAYVKLVGCYRDYFDLLIFCFSVLRPLIAVMRIYRSPDFIGGNDIKPFLGESLFKGSAPPFTVLLLKTTCRGC